MNELEVSVNERKVADGAARVGIVSRGAECTRMASAAQEVVLRSTDRADIRTVHECRRRSDRRSRIGEGLQWGFLIGSAAWLAYIVLSSGLVR